MLNKNKRIILLFIVTITSTLLGFIKEASIVYSMGVSKEADIFIFASNLPIILFSAMGNVVSTSFMPIYTDIRISYDDDESNRFATQFLKYILLVCVSLTLVGELFPSVFIRFMAPGLQEFALTNLAVRIVLPSIIFLGIIYIFVGVLNSHNKVIVTSSVQIPMHLALIISTLMVYKKLGISYSLLMILIGSIMQIIFVYFSTKKLGFKIKDKSIYTNKFLNNAFKMIIPMGIGAMAMQINSLIATNMASRLEAGSITLINIANKLYTASYSTIGYLLVIVIYPVLSELSARKQYKKFNEKLNDSLIKSLIVITPVMLLMIILSEDAVRFFFGNELFGEEKINITAKILAIYSTSLVFWGIKDILNRAYYSLKETKISMINGIVTVITNIIFSTIFINKLGIIGLALASTISSIVSVTLLIKKLKNVGLSLDIKRFFAGFSKIVLSGIIVVICITILRYLPKWTLIGKLNQFIMLSIIVIITLILYSIVSFILFKKDLIKKI